MQGGVNLCCFILLLSTCQVHITIMHQDLIAQLQKIRETRSFHVENWVENKVGFLEDLLPSINNTKK